MLVKDLIEKIPSDTFDRGTKANKRYNQMTRDAIRSETRLKLKPSSKAKTRGVSVHVDDVGYPDEIGDRHISAQNKLAAILSLIRTSLIKLRDSSKDIGDFLNQGKDHKLEDFSNIVLEAFPEISRSSNSILETHKIAELLLSESDKFNLVKDILSVDHDILGAYFFDYSGQRSMYDLRTAHSNNGSSKIKLYWGVIGLVANSMGLETEDVTAVVMAHELAHAYTHLGFDIDLNRWDSDLFFDSEHGLKEGLAQYYTERAMTSLQDKIPGGLEAYEELLKNQPEAYRKHIPWMNRSTPESVRNALILLRSKNRPVKLKTFDDVLNKITPNYNRNLKTKLE